LSDTSVIEERIVWW